MQPSSVPRSARATHKYPARKIGSVLTAVIFTAFVGLASIVTVSSPAYGAVTTNGGAVVPASAFEQRPSDSQVTTIPAPQASGSVTGTVSAAGDGGVLRGVLVDVYDRNGNFYASAATESDGTFTVPGLADSTPGYTVCFDAANASGGRSTTGYASQCYRNIPWTSGQPAPAEATSVPVAAGQATTGVNASLVAEGAITGEVMEAVSWARLNKVDVRIFDSGGGLVGEVYTEYDGHYTVNGLPASTSGYIVCFNAVNASRGGSTTGYASECYHNIAWASGQPAPVGANPVPVTAGKATHIDAALTAAGAIAGKVTAADGGAGLASVFVNVYDSSGHYVTTAVTGFDGRYTVARLDTSTQGYIVCFEANSASGGVSTSGYASECYHDIAWTSGQPAPVGANPVPVTAGKATHIDVTLPTAGMIAGKVTAAGGGAGLGNVEVRIYSSSKNYLTSAVTRSDGTYTSTRLAVSGPGYIVCFNAANASGGGSTTGYASQCFHNIAWNDGPIPDGTTRVLKCWVRVVSGIDATLLAAVD